MYIVGTTKLKGVLILPHLHKPGRLTCGRQMVVTEDDLADTDLQRAIKAGKIKLVGKGVKAASDGVMKCRNVSTRRLIITCTGETKRVKPNDILTLTQDEFNHPDIQSLLVSGSLKALTAPNSQFNEEKTVDIGLIEDPVQREDEGMGEFDESVIDAMSEQQGPVGLVESVTESIGDTPEEATIGASNAELEGFELDLDKADQAVDEPVEETPSITSVAESIISEEDEKMAVSEPEPEPEPEPEQDDIMAPLNGLDELSDSSIPSESDEKEGPEPIKEEKETKPQERPWGEQEVITSDEPREVDPIPDDQKSVVWNPTGESPLGKPPKGAVVAVSPVETCLADEVDPLGDDSPNTKPHVANPNLDEAFGKQVKGAHVFQPDRDDAYHLNPQGGLGAEEAPEELGLEDDNSGT